MTAQVLSTAKSRWVLEVSCVYSKSCRARLNSNLCRELQQISAQLTLSFLFLPASKVCTASNFLQLKVNLAKTLTYSCFWLLWLNTDNMHAWGRWCGGAQNLKICWGLNVLCDCWNLVLSLHMSCMLTRFSRCLYSIHKADPKILHKFCQYFQVWFTECTCHNMEKCSFVSMRIKQRLDVL